jgi:hypothetical protein
MQLSASRAFRTSPAQEIPCYRQQLPGFVPLIHVAAQRRGGIVNYNQVIGSL